MTSASSFLDFRILIDRNWSCLSCLEALQIWPPSEQTLLERNFDLTEKTKCGMLDTALNCHSVNCLAKEGAIRLQL